MILALVDFRKNELAERGPFGREQTRYRDARATSSLHDFAESYRFRGNRVRVSNVL